jgi:hypothetical protein
MSIGRAGVMGALARMVCGALSASVERYGVQAGCGEEKCRGGRSGLGKRYADGMGDLQFVPGKAPAMEVGANGYVGAFSRILSDLIAPEMGENGKSR